MPRPLNPYVLALGIAFVILSALDQARAGWLALAIGCVLIVVAWRT